MQANVKTKERDVDEAHRITISDPCIIHSKVHCRRFPIHLYTTILCAQISYSPPSSKMGWFSSSSAAAAPTEGLLPSSPSPIPHAPHQLTRPQQSHPNPPHQPISPQPSNPQEKLLPNQNPAASAKTRNPPAMNACYSAKATTRRKTARARSTSTRAAWPATASRYDTV